MVDRQRLRNVTLENVQIIKRNFSGREGRFGGNKRTFLALLRDDLAEAMQDDGWKIGVLTPRNEEDKPQAFLPVEVRFNPRPPRIVMVTSHGKNQLDEDTVGVLDFADISNIDLIVHPSVWDVNGKSGVKAYAQTMFVTLELDELEEKYYDVPDSVHDLEEN
jgi:hypothetical protein